MLCKRIYCIIIIFIFYWFLDVYKTFICMLVHNIFIKIFKYFIKMFFINTHTMIISTSKTMKEIIEDFNNEWYKDKTLKKIKLQITIFYPSQI